MKKILLLLVGVLVSCLCFGQTSIWSSDFSNTADWEISNNSATGSLNWVFTNTKPTTFNKTESNWINSFTAFNSKSMGNYAVVDGTNTGDGTRTAIITSKNSFSTSGKSKIKVSFSQFYTKWQDVTSLEVSTDKTNWTPFVCNANVAKGGSTLNGNVYSVDISSVASDKPQVWIRFVYAGKVGDYDYAWFIDDVSVEEIVANELSALSAFFYSKSSACGLTNDKVGFAVINNGTAVVPNGTSVAYKVNNGTEVVESVNWLSTKLQAKSSFAKGDTAIYFFNTPVDLTSTQTYTVKVYSKLNGDGNVSNDTAKTTIINYSPTFVTNQNIFNEDFENSVDKTGGFTAETIDQNGIKFGVASVGNSLVNSASVSNCFRIYENNVSRVSEDWLYSRCLNLSPDYTYTLTFYNRVGALSSGKNAGKIQTSIGSSPVSSAMTTVIGAEKSLKPDGNYYVNTNTFSVNSEGVYYIGFRARNTAADSTINLRIDDVSITAKGNKAEVLTFGVNATSLVQGTVNSGNNTITVTVPNGTSKTALITIFTVSPGATIKLNNNSFTTGSTFNYSSNVTCLVTSEDGKTTKTYTVQVVEAAGSFSAAKDFLTFSINGKSGVIGTNTISFTLPAGTDLSNLTAVYTTSPKSTVTTGANTTNFTNVVTYVVTAEDGSTKTYTVTVTVSSTNLNNTADLLTFGFANPNVKGVINGTSVTVSVPYGTNINSLVASFTVSTGAVVKVSNIVQISGGSVVDYTAPVTLVIISEDGKTIKTFIINVTITPLLSSSKDLLTFGFASPSAQGSISGNTVGLTVPFGTNVSALIANFTSSANSIVRVGSTIQVSGTTPNNFTTSVLYTVVAQDGSMKDYTVVVTISPQSGTGGSSAKEILSFGLLNPYINGSISANTITITGQAGSDITKQQIYFSVSPGATLTLNGVVLTSAVSVVNFSNPVTVTVTAADGTKKDYVIIVTLPKKNGKLITFFKFLEVPSATATIDDVMKIITVHVPFGTSLNLTSVFGVSAGATVSIGGILQASGASQISYASNVNYVVTAEDGTTTTYTIKVIVDSNTSGLEDVDNTVVRIFPNPSNGAFTCESSIETYEIIVTDILGHTVYASRVEPNGTGTHTFDVSDFGSGVYFATLQFEGTSKIFKLEVVK